MGRLRNLLSVVKVKHLFGESCTAEETQLRKVIRDLLVSGKTVHFMQQPSSLIISGDRDLSDVDFTRVNCIIVYDQS